MREQFISVQTPSKAAVVRMIIPTCVGCHLCTNGPIDSSTKISFSTSSLPTTFTTSNRTAISSLIPSISPSSYKSIKPTLRSINTPSTSLSELSINPSSLPSTFPFQSYFESSSLPLSSRIATNSPTTNHSHN